MTSSNGGSGTGSAAGAESPGTSYTLQAGKQYSVAESGGPSGYTESDSADCTIPSAALGATYTCTITNDDIAPTLTSSRRRQRQRRHGGCRRLEPGGDVRRTAAAAPAARRGAGSPGTSYTLQAGKANTASPRAAARAGTRRQTRPTARSASAALGATYTCTITNDDNAPTPDVIKTSSTTTAARRSQPTGSWR